MPKKNKSKSQSKNQPTTKKDKRSPSSLHNELAGQLIRLRAQEVYRKKNLRRQIVADFLGMSSTYPICRLAPIYSFLQKYSHDLALVRDALSDFKSADDSWSQALWELLTLTDEQIQERVSWWINNPSGLVDEQLIAKIVQSVQQPLTLIVPTTVDGPNWDAIGAESILAEVRRRVGDPLPEMQLMGSEGIRQAGSSHVTIESVSLRLPIGTPIPIQIKLQFECGSIPADLNEMWATVPDIDLRPGLAIPHQLNLLLRENAMSKERSVWLARVLKAAYATGYWKTESIQAALRDWEAISAAEKLGRGSTTVMPQAQPYKATPLPARTSAEQAYGAQFGWDDLLHGEGEEAEKLRILNVPPLVAYDLLTAKVDLNSLQYLFKSPDLLHLSGEKLEDFTEADIRTLSNGIRTGIRKLRQQHPELGVRNLANICLSVARLQFERLETGTSEAGIRFCLSGYASRMGQYLIEQHNRFDVARDYYLEAIALNLVLGQNSQFPTALLFRSFPDSKVYHDLDDAGYFLRMLDAGDVTEQVIDRSARSFLELAAQDFGWANRWFNE